MNDTLLPTSQRLVDARERAIRLLTDRYADDTLSVEDFEARLDRLYLTATPADADALVADLGMPETESPTSYRTSSHPPLLARDERLDCVFGERTFTAHGSAPRTLEVHAVFGEVTIDLRHVGPHDRCAVEVEAVFSSVRLLVPADAEVRVYAGTVLGEVTDDTQYERAPAGRALIELRGTAVLAEIAVRRSPSALGLGGAPFKTAWKAAGAAAKATRRALKRP